MKKLKVPTAKQIEAEIALLEKMKPAVRQYSAFGDDNHASIDAQIEVLNNMFDDDDVYNNAEEPDGEWPQYVVDSALEAVRWLEGDNEEPPSDDWKPLLVN